jgi:hypothetical protein
MKLASLVLAFVFVAGVWGQSGEGNIPAARTTVVVNPCPYVYVDAPRGFVVVDRQGNTDYWYSKITSKDTKPSISVKCGTVESIFEKNKGHLTDVYTDENDGTPIRFASVKTTNETQLLAQVFWAQFSAIVSSDDEARVFYDIVKTFRKTVSRENK